MEGYIPQPLSDSQYREKGHVPASYHLASMIEHGRGIERNIAQAKALYQLAAEKGHSQSQSNLALLLMNGSPEDRANAVTWIQKAAEKGHGQSQYNLSMLYLHGDIITQDKEKAMQFK